MPREMQRSIRSFKQQDGRNMSETYIKDFSKVVEQLSRFTTYVHYKDGKQGFISFRDSTGILGRNEDFKSTRAEEARKELKYKEWDESWIGTGKIAQCAKNAIDKAENLVYPNQRYEFHNRLTPEHPHYRKEAEQVLFDIYSNPQIEESKAFASATEVFGKKYDIIAFLFFIKDDTRFLPVSTTHFDDAFKILGIKHETTRQCSWKNYQAFISIISEIRDIMETVLPMQGIPRLVDAHSFAWIIQGDKFRKWSPDKEQSIQIEQAAEESIQTVVTGASGRKTISSSGYNRSAEVVKETKRRAKGVCQLCKQPAPFIDKKGNPYLESHHVVWLSRGGEDSTANTVALCPNCHTKMHVLDRSEDVDKLKKIIEYK